MKNAGVDTSIYSAHSTRGASASKAVANGVSIDSVLQTANWSRESTFTRFYHRNVASHTVASAILDEN